MTTRLHEAIGTIVHEHMHEGAIGGAVVLVQRDGETIDMQAHGHADFDPSFQLKTDSVFGMMSMTKPVAAACAMKLVSDGEISLDDPVSRFIPEFARPRTVRTLKPGQSYPPFPPPPGAEPPPEPEYEYAAAEREITVRHLLSFTSGLQTIGVPNGAPAQAPDDTLASYIPKLDAAPLEFQPGTQWHYSNATGYDVLGRVIEVASGQSFQDFARTRLFEPLGMSQTQFGANPDLSERIVPLGFLANAPVAWPHYASGSAGLFSTAEDYARFAQMLLDEGVYADRRILRAEAVAAMHENQIGDLPFCGIRVGEYAVPVHRRPSAYTYGFGVGILAKPSLEEGLPVGSYGWDGVGTRRFWVIPAQRTVLIMLMPGMGTAAEPAHKAIEAAVIAAASA